MCEQARSSPSCRGARWSSAVSRLPAASLVDVELIDLRTLSPWDREAVIQSVQKTRRCLIVHEDTFTAGFGAEIAAVVAKEAFYYLDAPVERLTMPDIPNPHSPVLLEAAVPTAAGITLRHSENRERLTRMTNTLDIRAPADQTEGTRSQVLRWLKTVGDPSPSTSR